MGNQASLHELAFLGKDDQIRGRLGLDPAGWIHDINNVNSAGETALQVASRAGKTTTVRLLLDFNANPRTKNKLGITALHSAAAMGHTNVLLALVEAGAMIDALDLEQCTPLHHACHHGRVEAVLALINAGADASGVNVYDRKALDLLKDDQLRDDLVEHAHALIENWASVDVSNIQCRPHAASFWSWLWLW